MIGTTVHHYRVVGKVGGGGMGVVWRAEDTWLQRPLALKFLNESLAQEPASLERFLREARAASSVNHPNICTVYEVGEHQGHLYIAMELLEGRTLGSAIEKGPLPPGEVLEMALGVAQGLQAAHEVGIIHRDIKPQNIFLTRAGVKILDFGLAKLRPNPLEAGPGDKTASWGGGNLTNPGTTLGTVHYMSPEQARGEELDGRSDLFSLGVVLYEAATGRRPFAEGSFVMVFDAILHAEPPHPREIVPDLPEAVANIILRLLRKDRRDRYDDAAGLIADLQQAARFLDRGLTGPLLHPVAPVAPPRAPAPAAPPGPAGSLAILPFDNASRDPDTEYLCDGLAEALINVLSTLPRLRVMARGTVFRYKGKPADPLEVGRELKVSAVLVGRVVQRGADLLVSAELVDGQTGFRLWGDQYDRRLDDLASIQDELCLEISRQLRLKLSGEEEARLTHQRPVHPGAHQAYLVGRHHWNRWSPEGFARAIESYERATTLDPDYALGWAGLADALSGLGLYALRPPREVFPRAREAALRAVELDGNLAEAHVARAVVRFFHEWDWRAAREDFRRALDLNPGFAAARRLYSTVLSAAGSHTESRQEALAAIELDPLSLVAQLNLGWALYHGRRFGEAAEQCRQLLELDPSFPRAIELLGLAEALAGHPDAAALAARRAYSAQDGSPRSLALCGFVFAATGHRTEARACVDALRELSARTYVPALSMTFVSAALGKTDVALGWLERAFDEQDCLMVWLREDARLDAVRSHPRFQDVQERVGLRLW